MGDEDIRSLPGFVEDLLAIKPLACAYEGSLRIHPAGSPPPTGGWEEIPSALNAMAGPVGLPPLELRMEMPADVTSFEIACSRKLALDASRFSFLEASLGSLEAISAKIGVLLRSRERISITRHILPGAAGDPLIYYTCGNTANPCVLISSACGMPAALCEKWLIDLGRNFHAVVHETRGLFAIENGELGAVSLESQAGDILGILAALGKREAHIMGFCGGAVIALQAACMDSGAIKSLSLWHGDFDFAGKCAKTTHQKDVGMLMSMSGSSRQLAASLHKMFRRPSFLDSLPADLAHLVMYPYASGELLHRYGKLNGVIMTTDIRRLLPLVEQPVLVVTSDDDSTAHPDGSKMAARMLAAAELRVEEKGDHISLFRAGEHLTALAQDFIARHHSPGAQRVEAAP